MGTDKPSISAFFPCYNDSGTIGSMVVLMEEVLKELSDDFEVIVVEDCGSDDSLQILEALQKDHPCLKIVAHPQNRGYGGALRSGFKTASKDLVFYTDGDAQYDVKELNVLYEEYQRTGADVVNGYKLKRNDPWYRIVIGKCYQYTMKLMFGLKIRDVDCDFRLIQKKVFDRVTLQRDSGVICVEMVKRIQDAGFSFAEVPVHHYFRLHGKSQFFNFARVFRVGLDLIRLWLELVLFKKIGLGR